MAQGSNKRTYNLTDEAVQMLEVLSDEGRLDKSDNVDRAVKLYWRLLDNGQIKDPYIDPEVVQRMDHVVDAETSVSKVNEIREKLFGGDDE